MLVKPAEDLLETENKTKYLSLSPFHDSDTKNVY